MKGRKKKKRDQGLEEGNLKSGRKPLTSSAFSRASPSLFNDSFTHTHGVALLLSLSLFFFFSLVLCAFVYAGIRRCDKMEHKEAISKATLSHNTIIDEIFPDYCDGIFSDDPAFPFKNRDILNDLLSYSEQAETSLWSQNLKPRQSSVSAAIDSQSSICVGSPMSTTKPKDKANVTTSGSSRELSDNEDLEIEAGPCEQSTDPTDLKRMRRMVSNKESARRSRKRKQAHLADLEFQVEKLRGENSSVYEQLTGAIQQYCEADTNNRVLESDVEALRAKVTLAEDMVARGCNLNQLLQNHLNPSSLLSSQSLRRLANVSPTVTVRVHGDGAYAGMAVSGQNSSVGLVNADINNNCNCNLRSDCGSCVSDVWP